MLLSLAHRYEDTLAANVLHWRWYARTAWSLEASGGLCGIDIDVPGYRYRNTEWSEECNWGGVGFAAHALIGADT